MKKLILTLTLAITLISCNYTTESQDMEMLQKKYPTTVVYEISPSRYIVCDSAHVYVKELTNSGDILTTIKIK